MSALFLSSLDVMVKISLVSFYCRSTQQCKILYIIKKEKETNELVICDNMVLN